MARDVPTYAGECVHEILAAAAVACVGQDTCTLPHTCDEVRFDGFRAGVRWNDDPLRLLDYGKTYGIFGVYMKNAESIAHRNPRAIRRRYNTMYRSHFGDLSFLHSMAMREGEPAAETVAHMLAWAEFTYRIGTGEISGDTALADVRVAGIADLFSEKHWTVWQLLSLRCSRLKSCHSGPVEPARLRLIALGSLLHLVQDSYALGHTQRTLTVTPDGTRTRACFSSIARFHVYFVQDSTKHRSADLMPSWANREVARGCDNPLDASTRILEFAALRGGNPADWSTVMSYLNDGPFRLEHTEATADAGDAFARRSGH